MNDLDLLYRQARYVIDDGEAKFTIRLGADNAELREFLAGRGIATWSFLTAYNPQSKPLSDEENAARQAELVRSLDSQGFKYLNGYGTGDDWDPEASLFILDISREAALRLGRQFGQHAILWGESGVGGPELVWC